MDTQIWYAIFCTIFGGFYGIFHHLGEVRFYFSIGIIACFTLQLKNYYKVLMAYLSIANV